MERKLRKWHRWVSIIFLLPMLVTIVTGSILILRSYLDFVQPAKTPAQKVNIARVAPLSKVADKAVEHYAGELKPTEITSLRYSPSKGYFSVRTKIARELRLHGETLEVLAEGPKRTTFLVKLHEGAYFGSWARNFIFFPSGLGLLFLSISGATIFFMGEIRLRKSKS